MSQHLSVREILDGAGHPIAASRTDGGDRETALIVCIPGGGYTGGYFEVGDSCFMASAYERGHAALAIDRPAYGESGPLTVETDWYPTQSRIIEQAIDDAWQKHGDGRPGIILVGHSFGATIALRIAGMDRRWPLLGVSIDGTSGLIVPSMTDLAGSLVDMPIHLPLALGPEAIRSMFYGPEGSYDESVFAAAASCIAPAPAIEIREWVSQWPLEVEKVAAGVTVPVQIRLSEHDSMQPVDAESLAVFSALFTASPRVDAGIYPNCGHNTDHHLGGRQLNQDRLAFAASCV
ncbi:alpha/beta hydrolase [Rhodococcus sp. IEGM 1381]|uniref:alpha/beta hydrolase n=1 Tax=Rhodococcus sp. IEGM 1381 TaxID=3047085 RepID=UPI0024B74D28|nr:alpha/beta hydrolase [Rhodococcus sp. IEGM 1381]MDI9897401.1 alpha/beta hydrolase [Rhodococcus sp. IEGM 1381]